MVGLVRKGGGDGGGAIALSGFHYDPRVSGQTVARKMEKKQMANLPSINGRESRENGGKFT